MKILYISPQAPLMSTGGGRHCYANLRSLCEYPNATVDYIGPSSSTFDDFQQYKFNILAARDFTSFDRVIAALKGIPSSLGQVFSEVKNRIDFSSYDLVFIEFSYIDFIYDYLPQNTLTICCVHNVEADYHNINRIGLGKVKYYLVRKNEQRAIKKASTLLVMHHYDLCRLESVYKTKLENYVFHPVCSFPPHNNLINTDDREKTILFSGSLDSMFNEIGLIQFLKICWNEMQNCGYTLLVAGRNPSKKIIATLTQYKNTKIIANPPDMETILQKVCFMVLPDLYGTGMKLRVAEAISYGVPVVGTRLGLRGYNEAELFGIAVDTIPDMKNAALTLINSTETLKQLSKNAVEIWKQNYTFEKFRSRVHSTLNLVLLK